ncbi:uncharacterized protein MELLADRAFT_94290 [Melampsora larici-populina 98AG31]|uniref:Tyrosinase copper-binding domain-containing protein n=1 Tax=Melampsora larici-populina (strain 98AG31 / pathotype 3-4-7) TaxID=747676 RepID=F4S769_MELLP|nr:uncharacterized protein MELLADRAFT_94290 [Melampsora larici-populina 98AG31]EGF99458.1 hypothetical protein MELLADRAFT_94290 [Melampsora larici-populina 98AG31]
MKNILFRSILFCAGLTTTLCHPRGAKSPSLAPRNQQYCPNPSVRVSWYTFTPQEKTAMQDAIMCLMNAPSKMKYPGAVTRYDDLVAIHQLQSDYPNGNDKLHVTARFLYWHRLYLLLFELLLRVECGYTGKMAYWDEKVDAGNFRNSVAVKDFGGPGNENGYVVDGRFGYTIVNMGPRSQSVRRYLTRQINETASAFASQEHYDLLMSQQDSAGFMKIMRLFLHMTAHGGLKGCMGDVQSSPVDPIFHLHHMYVDYLWFKWQNVDPARRTFDLREAGYESQRPPFTDVPMYAAADTQGGFLCYIYE